MYNSAILLYFDQINAALVSLLSKTLQITTLKVWTAVYYIVLIYNKMVHYNLLTIQCLYD